MRLHRTSSTGISSGAAHVTAWDEARSAWPPTPAWLFQGLASMLDLPQLRLGEQGRDGCPVTGLWTVEITPRMLPIIVIGVVHQHQTCRAALAVMPDDPYSPLPTRCMSGDDVVLAAEKQLRYVPLLGQAGVTRDPEPSSIHYRVRCSSQDACASVSFMSPDRGPLRTLATTLHQLLDHVARCTDALDSLPLALRKLACDDAAAE